MKRIGVTAGFGMYNPFGKGSTMHYAIDVSRTQPNGFEIFAAHDGTAVLSAYDYSGGNIIVLQGSYNESIDIITRYAHLKSRAVKKGATVKRGELIGFQGNTGAATTGQHLHFETWLVPKGYSYRFSDRDKYAVDPLAVCELLSTQTFVSDSCTRGLEAIPYPEPAVESLSSSKGTVQILRNLPFGLYPSHKYAFYSAGENRRRCGILDFCAEKEYELVYTCENEGSRWALVMTGYGAAWLELLEGKAVLKEELKATPQNEESTQTLRTQRDAYRQLLAQIRKLTDTF